MNEVVRIVSAIGAAASAGAAALLAYPGDVVPQGWLVGAVVIAAAASAFVAMMKPEPDTGGGDG